MKTPSSAQPDLFERDRPAVLVVAGSEYLSTIADLKRQGATITTAERIGKTPGRWRLRICWPTGSRGSGFDVRTSSVCN